jgi:hypothetical protein
MMGTENRIDVIETDEILIDRHETGTKCDVIRQIFVDVM